MKNQLIESSHFRFIAFLMQRLSKNFWKCCNFQKNHHSCARITGSVLLLQVAQNGARVLRVRITPKSLGFGYSLLNKNAFCNRREQGNCQICYSAAALTDVHLSGSGKYGATKVSNLNIYVTKSYIYHLVNAILAQIRILYLIAQTKVWTRLPNSFFLL